MKKQIATLPILCALATPAFADTLLGIYAGGGSIDFDVSGTFQDLDNGGTQVDLEKDLNITGDSGTYFYVALEHGIPIVPNIKIARTMMDETATSRLSKTITFDDVTFPQNTPVTTSIDLSHTDFTFYYEVLDNWLNLDLGLTARQFDGGIDSHITGFSNYKASLDLNFTAPLLYAKAQIDLPLSGLYVGGDLNWIGYSGSQFHDIWARVGYVFKFGLGLELGYRQMKLKLDDVESLDADVTVDGNYLAATFHF